MNKLDLNHHISEEYNAELEDLRNQVLSMGGLVEQQISDALEALENLDGELGENVVYTDHKVGTIRRMSPITADGTPDPGRGVLFVGQASIVTPMGSIPLTFEIEATTLREALDRFPEAAQVALVQTVEDINEMRREAASSIVVPGAGGAGGGFGGPGGGPIQMP